MARSILFWTVLSVFVLPGCGKTEPPAAELNSTTQEEIKKHDAAVEAAEGAHDAQPPKKK